jgi:hypothetical protein
MSINAMKIKSLTRVFDSPHYKQSYFFITQKNKYVNDVNVFFDIK